MEQTDKNIHIIMEGLEKCKIEEDSQITDVTSAKKQITSWKIVSSIIQEMATPEDIMKEEIGKTTDNLKEADMTTKEVLYNNKSADLTITTTTTEDNRKITTTIEMEEDITQNLIEDMKRMIIQDKNKDMETRNIMNNTLT
ncbi:hypothetical protein C1646_768912 [Rhizophagus diaphanus]|nr:hypothetical protein C1646_768912 [Rhizophagus diaphanus] [Rhizophagus sp. MUCL 43196]